MSTEQLEYDNSMVTMEKYKALIIENRELMDMYRRSVKLNECLSNLIRQHAGAPKRKLKSGEKIIPMWPSLN